MTEFRVTSQLQIAHARPMGYSSGQVDVASLPLFQESYSEIVQPPPHSHILMVTFGVSPERDDDEPTA